jgi:hypothetical protein
VDRCDRKDTKAAEKAKPGGEIQARIALGLAENIMKSSVQTKSTGFSKAC